MLINIWFWRPAASDTAKRAGLKYEAGQVIEGELKDALAIMEEVYKANLAVAIKPVQGGNCLIMIDLDRSSFQTY